jgi:hypothetical protein
MLVLVNLKRANSAVRSVANYLKFNQKYPFVIKDCV